MLAHLPDKKSVLLKILPNDSFINCRHGAELNLKSSAAKS